MIKIVKVTLKSFPYTTVTNLDVCPTIIILKHCFILEVFKTHNMCHLILPEYCLTLGYHIFFN